jgi:hypothetical protein
MKIRALTRLRDPNYKMLTDEDGNPIIDPKNGQPKMGKVVTELAKHEVADLPDWQAGRLIQLGHAEAVE